MTIEPGRCRYCGCSGESCKLADGELCCWADAARTVCSGPSCVRQYQARRREAQRAAKPRKLTPPEVHDLICGRRCKAKKRRAA